MNSAEWAAWVQAVGSILAIAAGFGVAWWQRRGERTDRKTAEASEARAMAILLHNDVLVWEGQITRASTDPDVIERVIPMPKSVADRMDRMHRLGDTGEGILWCCSIVAAHNTLTADIREARGWLSNEAIAAYSTSAWERFRLTAPILEKVVKDLENIGGFEEFMRPEKI